MNNLEELWLGICIFTVILIFVVIGLCVVTWLKIDLIYDIVRKKKWGGEVNGQGEGN